MLGCAIICEYNPFHCGHERQIAELRKQFPEACITAILAGNFVQRGEPAVLSKYDRARAAVTCGVDLAVELPFPWSAQGAAYYARAGVSVAARIGCRILCFGSETGNLSALSTASARLTSDEFKTAFALEESEGMRTSASHISAVRSVYSRLYGTDLPLGANDTLALEYLSAIHELGAPLKPVCIRRETGFSATAAREYYRSGDAAFFDQVPSALRDHYNSLTPVPSDALGGVILGFLRTHEAAEFADCADLGGGIAERLKRAAMESSNYAEFVARAATKKYTDSRLRRAVLCAIAGVREYDVSSLPVFTTLLAANERGSAFLRENKKTRGINVITRPSDAAEFKDFGARQFALSSRADALWATAAGESPADQLRKTPFISINHSKQ